MALSIQDSRILLKRSTNTSEVPTAAPSSDFTDGTWTSLDVYVGEAFANTVDEKLWLRFTNNIRQIAVADSPTTNRLTYWNASGHLGNVVAPTDGYYLKYTNASGYHWATAGGTETQTLSDVLALGNTSGANDILMNTTRRIGFKDGDNTNTSYISNNQTAPSATMYLPHYDGRAVIHATGTSLVSGRVPYVTTNGLVADSANFTWDNSTKILAISNNGASGYTGTTSSSTSLAYAAYYNSDAAYTAISKRSSGVVGNVDATSIALANLGVVQSVSAGGASLAPMFIGGSVIYGVTSNTDVNAVGVRIGTAGVRIDKQNNLTSAASASLQVVGLTSDNTAYYFKGDDSSSAARFYGRNDGVHAINSSSLVSSAALKIKGRLIVSTQEVTDNDNYIAMLEVGVGNGVLFSNGTSGATAANRLGYIFGDGGLQIYGRDNADATKFFFSGKTTANRFEFYSADANTHFKMTSTGILYYTQAVNSDGFNVIRSNAATTTPTAYSAISVINADATANRVSVIGFAYQDNVARSGFIAARFINNTNGDLLLGNKKSGTEQTVLELTANGNQIMGTQAALATNATDGFLYVPSCAGTPTGTPTAYTGKTACVVDSTNGKFYIYSGGAWVALN